MKHLQVKLTSFLWGRPGTALVDIASMRSRPHLILLSWIVEFFFDLVSMCESGIDGFQRGGCFLHSHMCRCSFDGMKNIQFVSCICKTKKKIYMKGIFKISLDLNWKFSYCLILENKEILYLCEKLENLCSGVLLINPWSFI